MPSTRLPSTSTVASPVNCDDAYHFVGSPNGPVGPNFLVATAAINAGDIWAVGNTTSAGGWDQNLAMHWNGVNWTIFPTPNFSAFHNDFNAVAAISTNDVWAVGEYWVDGVASAINTFAEHWDGTAWTSVATVQPSTYNLLIGVAAISTTNVWAVGTAASSTANTLVEQWNGTSWTQMASVNPSVTDNELFSVSAFSATDVFVVGEQSVGGGALQSLAQHWDGAAWTTLATPNLGVGGSDNEILGVTVLEAGHAAGVGYGNHTFDINNNTITPRISEVWDLVASGTPTSALHSGPGAGDNAILAVARSGAGVWGVGFWRNTIPGPRETMVFPATWDSTSHTLTWGQMGVSDSPSGINNALIGVTAISPYNFWAAGYDTNSLNTPQTLTEAYCAQNFNMTGPSTSQANFAFSVTVTVKNGNGTTATGYRGTVQFTSTDGAATLPANYAFLAGDNGAHTFGGVVLRTAGSQTILASDSVMPLTKPGGINVQVCVGLCQSSAGTPGSRGTNQGGAGTPGGRTGVNQSGAGTPGTRLPMLGVSSQTTNSAASTAPATSTAHATTVVAAGSASTSTSAESAPSAARAADAVTNDSSVQAPSLLAQRQPVVNPPDQTPWSVLLLIPLIACALALIAVRRRTSKETSNGRIRP
jgi:hypothetical protein